ncbi:hypothetical protein KVR01_001888 [Diaporthe batatas]|uniref:uncharacterized protein n=1 Tax=Diaporthe batatas TaxID=748121 RepID=UPI001D03838C|nr:uncharacterized protein KVR01_001888 [Diaporthe batatas]KAG8169139.1 hypothetical protein KVR01_001888 [Diaporthe batatas]
MIIRATLKFSETPSESSRQHGIFIVLGVITIYIGSAVVSGAYWHAVNSDVTRLRGLLFSAIFKRALVTEEAQEDGGNGAMVSLLSSDVDAVLQGFLWIHELWATPVTAAISMWMLYQEISISPHMYFRYVTRLRHANTTYRRYFANDDYPFPEAVTTMSSFLSKYLKSLQQTWLQSTAERSEGTLYVLRNMLGIKMSGSSKMISDVVMRYRHVEVEKSKCVPWPEKTPGSVSKFIILKCSFKLDNDGTLMPTAFLPANVSTLGITLATLSTFALLSKYTGEELNASKMFTALAILQLPMSSLQTLVASVPLMGATMASLQRIQAYLAQGGESSSGVTSTALTQLGDMSGVDALEKSWDEIKGEKQPPVFDIKDGTIGWTGSRPLMRNVSFDVRQADICFIYGQAGSGKSSLLDIIAGRAQALKSVASIAKSFTSAAYCEQSPWLLDDTIQNVIVGAERLDRNWLERVLSICCLTADIAGLEKGVNTLVGANGASLSGGQKKRVALARAIYSRNKVLLLDDPLASLDANSERILGETLLGPGGYFKAAGATVILTTSVAKYLHLADRVFEIAAEDLVERPAQSDCSAARRDNQLQTVLLDAGDTSTLQVEKECAGLQDATSGNTDAVGDRTMRAPTVLESDPAPKASLEEHKLYVSSLGRTNFIVFMFLSASIAVASLTRSFELKRISEYHSHDAYNHLGVYISLVSMTLILIFSWNWHFYIHGVGTSSIQLHKVQWEALIK